jgi:hypothetical protein
VPRRKRTGSQAGHAVNLMQRQQVGPIGSTVYRVDENRHDSPPSLSNKKSGA